MSVSAEYIRANYAWKIEFFHNVTATYLLSLIPITDDIIYFIYFSTRKIKSIFSSRYKISFFFFSFSNLKLDIFPYQFDCPLVELFLQFFF